LIILLVIQNEAIRNKVKCLLTDADHQVVATADSVQAVAVLKKQTIDAIVTEVDIGKVDGWRLARLIRSGVLVNNAALPVILITENHCERLAETTARIFDVNRVIAYQELNLINKIIDQLASGVGNLNKPPSILLIEDTADTAHLVLRMLKNQYQIDTAENGFLGLKAFKEKEYDIVLLDIMMPGMSGDQVLDIIIKTKPKQVVIAMTAHGTIDLAELMLEKGAADYIQKPFKADQLRKVCDIAAKREDFIISNEQFSAKALALENQQERFELLSKAHYRVLDNLTNTVIEITPKGRISFLNNAWQQSTDYMISESIGKPFTDFIHESSRSIVGYIEEAYTELLSGNRQEENIEFKLKKKNNDFFWVKMILSPYFDENDALFGISGTINDITVRKKAEQELKHVAFHDTLTGIHNRYYFDDMLINTAQTTARTRHQHSLMYIDLDHFKIINDSQGHHQGDLVLKEIALLLSERTRASDVLCRIGGDEFAIIVNNTNVEDAKHLGQDICKAISDASFKFEDKVYKVSCSIGIASIDGLALSSDLYLQQADIAMFVAKERGRNRVHIYTEDDQLTDEIKQSFEWAQQLQKALHDDSITLHFQPIIDVQTREVAYFEALVRLEIDGKLIFPDSFIGPLEKAGDMNILDRHVIGKALQMMSQHQNLETVAINLSAQAFSDDRLVVYIEEKLTQYNIAPARVIFELTESASLSNITGTQRLVNRLNELGCSFSIDDFGTGFSTFSYLKQIPAESVKIDGSFVKDMLKDTTDAALVKAIHDTAKALNKKTVAEFVEDEATLIKLGELGVHYAQGYHICKPMNIDQINQQYSLFTPLVKELEN
jgi:diguanylate cyclase (GGDEF)-like protein/PAS domain S-box-containing protein